MSRKHFGICYFHLTLKEKTNLEIKMILKWTIFLLCFNAVLAKPQGPTSDSNCNSLKDLDFSCVPSSQCSGFSCKAKPAKKIRVIYDDFDIRAGPPITESFGEVDCQAETEKVQYLDLECFSPKSSTDVLVCCHKSHIINSTEASSDVDIKSQANCQSFKGDDYICAAAEDCALSTCLIEENQQLPKIDLKEGSPFGPQSIDCKKEEDKVSKLNLDCITVKSSVSEDQNVCCHKSFIKSNQTKSTTTPNTVDSVDKTVNCNSFEKEGYKCVTENECVASACIVNGLTVRTTQQSGLITIDCELEKEKVDYYFFDCPTVKQVQANELVCCHNSLVNSTIQSKIHSTNIPLSTSQPAPVDKPGPACGNHFRSGVDLRAVGTNTDTTFGEWPHVCALFEGDEFVGGASLLTPGILLTAAHKVYDVTTIKARCGDWNLKIRNLADLEPYDYQERISSNILVHPNFDLHPMHNNIALLYFEEEFEIAAHVQPICLPKDLDDVSKEDCIGLGWGRDATGSATSNSDMLRQVGLPLWDDDKCKSKLGGKYHKSLICAGGKKGEDTCTGDGGGPLVCKNLKDDRYVQLGIVSFGSGNGCGLEGYPGAYSSVLEGLCFIHFATECAAFDKYKSYYDYPQCRGWFAEEEARIEARKVDVEKRLENNSLDKRTKEIAGINLRKANKALNYVQFYNNLCGKK